MHTIHVCSACPRTYQVLGLFPGGKLRAYAPFPKFVLLHVRSALQQEVVAVYCGWVVVVVVVVG